MNKQEFLDKIREGISCLPKQDIEHYVQYYSEMIDDRIEDGISEEEAVSAIGNPDAIIADILYEKRINAAEEQLPLLTKLKNLIAGNTTVFIILFLVISSPIWGSLLSAAVSVVAAVISIIIAMFALSVGLAASFAGLIAAGVVVLVNTTMTMKALFLIGAGLICAGLAVVMFLLASISTKGIIKLAKFLFNKVKAFIESKKEVSL